MAWYVPVQQQLRDSGMFGDIQLVGGKVRASLDDTRFLDIHFDPINHSYSYALIDLSLSVPGDKRVLGWDDYPHPGMSDLSRLPTHPHHFQERMPDGQWRFAASTFRGDIEKEVEAVLTHLRQHLD